MGKIVNCIIHQIIKYDEIQKEDFGGHAPNMTWMINTYKFLVRKFDGKSFGRPRRGGEANVQIGIKQIG
jgi:hypothetical protein